MLGKQTRKYARQYVATARRAHAGIARRVEIAIAFWRGYAGIRAFQDNIHAEFLGFLALEVVAMKIVVRNAKQPLKLFWVRG